MNSLGLVTAPLRTERHALLALALGAAATAAALLALPYLLALAPPSAQQLHLTAPLLLLGLLQSLGIYMAVAWLGLRVGYDYALDAPLLRRWLGGGPSLMTAPSAWRRAILLGAASGLIVLGLLALWPVGSLESAIVAPAWWRGLLASFYGGTTEEVLLRLCVMSLAVWCGARLTHGKPTPAVYIGAIVAASALFGIGHLPWAAQLLGHLDALVVLQVILLNAICGLAFGWLFWRHGLEHAMIAHFSADIVLHVAAPLAAGLAGGTS